MVYNPSNPTELIQVCPKEAYLRSQSSSRKHEPEDRLLLPCLKFYATWLHIYSHGFVYVSHSLKFYSTTWHLGDFGFLKARLPKLEKPGGKKM